MIGRVSAKIGDFGRERQGGDGERVAVVPALDHVFETSEVAHYFLDAVVLEDVVESTNQ